MKIFLTYLFLIASHFLFSQNFQDYLRENAIPFELNSALKDSIYASIENNSIIMIGETHGTMESAQFAESLAKLIVAKEGKVSLGIEIPAQDMKGIDQVNALSRVNNTEFFSRENTDGRNGVAWRDLVVHCLQDSLIDLFFFDNSNEFRFRGIERDSAMYLSVLEQYKKDPEVKIITISGNIHNMMIPMGDMKTMGSYIKNDTVNFNKTTICSLNHVYSEGTMMNNTGNGLELNTVEFEESVFSETISADNYFLVYQTAVPDKYNGLFYTRKIHFSPVIEE